MTNLTVFAQVAERGKCREDKKQQFGSNPYFQKLEVCLEGRFLVLILNRSTLSPLEDPSPEMHCDMHNGRLQFQYCKHTHTIKPHSCTVDC